MLAVQGIEIHRGPGSGAAGSLDDGRDKLLALTLELGQQHLGLDQKLETVFGKVGIARRYQTAQFQLHQQGFKRQLTDIALIG